MGDTSNSIAEEITRINSAKNDIRSAINELGETVPENARLDEMAESIRAVGGRYLPLSGGTMNGALMLSGEPETDLQAATKKYVDDESKTIVYTYAYNSTQSKFQLLELTQNVYETIGSQLAAGKNIRIKAGYFYYDYVGNTANETDDLVFTCLHLFRNSDNSFKQQLIRIANDDTISEYKTTTIQQFVKFNMVQDSETQVYSIEGLDTPYDTIRELYVKKCDVAISSGISIYRIEEVSSSSIYFKKNAVNNSGAVKTYYFRINSDNTITAFYVTIAEANANKVSDISANTTDEVKYPSCKAVADYVTAAIPKLGISSGAVVGQFAKVKVVDENGVPTEWETGEAKTYTAGDGIAVSEDGVISAPKTTEAWTFTLADGSTVTKTVVIGS